HVRARQELPLVPPGDAFLCEAADQLVRRGRLRRALPADDDVERRVVVDAVLLHIRDQLAQLVERRSLAVGGAAEQRGDAGPAARGAGRAQGGGGRTEPPIHTGGRGCWTVAGRSRTSRTR